MTKGRFVTYQVEGGGTFPFDMLRYDTAWPSKEIETPLLAPYRVTLGTRRTISITGLRKPTVERWASFGWKVVDGSIKEV